MISKLTGKIEGVYEDQVILDVNGVGYGVFASSSTISELQARINNVVSLFIETHVREDHIHLYGFLNIEEKTAFNLLQTVSGIGSKVALNILSYLTPEQIQNTVDTKDKAMFTTISGIGPKLAERMILELKGKKFSANTYVAATSKALQDNNIIEEAAGALSNLGINKQEAVNIVKNILQNDPNQAIDQVIRIALQSRNTK